MFPEFAWDATQFSRGYWTHLSNQRKFMDLMGTELNITKPEDWYDVSPQGTMIPFHSPLHRSDQAGRWKSTQALWFDVQLAFIYVSYR